MLAFCINCAMKLKIKGVEFSAAEFIFSMTMFLCIVHSVIVAKEAVNICGFRELDHPPYIADLAPSDYYLFSKSKSGLRGKRFNVDDAVIRATTEHFEDKASD